MFILLEEKINSNRTGLHYNFLRYYKAETGRFVNQDPIGLEGGANLYFFAPNGQVWVDPLGLERNRYIGKSCNELASIIDRLINAERKSAGSGTKGLKCRFEEQINGSSPPGSQGWNNHQRNIENDQKALRRALDAWDKGGCGPKPPGAMEWATKPLPTAADYKGDSSSSTAAKVAVGVGAGYVIYRAVRMLPSLLPPLWPTIPANAAIP